MRRQAFLLVAALSALSATSAAFPVTDLQRAGPATQRFNVAILGDGYRASDQTKLTNDARDLLDALFAAAPYQPYRQLFNFKVVQTVSVDQGAKDGSAGGTPDTLFGAYFNCEGVSQLVCMNDGDVLSAAAADVPEFNLAVVIVNDSKYGGAGGSVPCVSTDQGAAEILRHELGHTLANLADEYQDPYPGYPACSTSDDCTEPNATVRRVRSQIKWLDWIADSTPLPTSAATGFAGVGLFEGARYMASGVYRPVASACKMRSLGNPFCPVCSEALVRSFWNLENVHLIDRVSPAADLAETTCVDATFSVETPDIAPGSTLTFSWTVDGEAATSRANSLLITPGTLSEGRHQIVVTVKDATSLVRNDPNGSLTESHTFDFNAPACEQMPAAGGAAGTVGTGTAGTGSAGSAGATLPAWGGAGTDGGTSAGSPSAGDAGDAGMGATPGMKPPPPKGSLGCGCRLGGSSGSGRPLALAALLGLAAFRRRRSARLLG